MIGSVALLLEAATTDQLYLLGVVCVFGFLITWYILAYFFDRVAEIKKLLEKRQ